MEAPLQPDPMPPLATIVPSRQPFCTYAASLHPGALPWDCHFSPGAVAVSGQLFWAGQGWALKDWREGRGF